MTRRVKTETVLVGIGAAVSKRRVELGLSQEDVALKAGLHRTYVSDVERGLRNVSVLTLERIAIALDTSLSVLLIGGLQRKPEPKVERVN